MTTTAVATAKPADQRPMQPGGALAAFVPQDSAQLLKLAEVLSRSGDMIPKQFQGNPPAIAAAMMRGMEIGLNPMQALSSIAIINGRATVWGDAIPALVQKAGHHIDVELTGEGDAMVATATLTRGDTKRTYVRRFSAADAKKAGLWGKAGPWQQYPGRMLSHRARTWAARDGAADALMGLHVSEEVQDYGPDRARDVTPAEAHKVGRVAMLMPGPVDEILEAESDPSRPSDEALAAAQAAAAAAIAARDEQVAGD